MTTAPQRSLTALEYWFSARTTRERAFLAWLVVAATLVLFAESMTALSVARSAAAESHAAVATSRSIQALHRSPAYVQAADVAARAARAASMGGDTIHIARARAQAEVEALAFAAGVVELDVTLAPRPAPQKAVGRPDRAVEPIRLSVEGDYDKDTFARFLLALSRSEYSLVPLSLNVVNHEDGARFQTLVGAYALVSAGGA
jgi:hypothetical protein